VAGEHDAGVVDHALLHRRGHHGVVLAREAAVDRAIEDFEDVAAVGRIERARGARATQRDVLYVGEILEQLPIAQGDQPRIESFAREQVAQLRADAGRLAGGERDDRAPYRSSSRSST
jgi:hypothetical protein